MKAILIKDVEGTGKAGELVNVKTGFFNNFLEKNGLALKATPDVIKRWKQDQARMRAEEAKRREEAGQLKEILEKTDINVKAKAGSEGRLFGSITSQDIADSIKKTLGIEIDKKKIELSEPIKEIGDCEVGIRVYPEMLANIKVHVVEA